MADLYVRLKHQDSCFTDPHSPFFISGSEVKLLPEPHSPVVSQWLNAGGLIIVGAPDDPEGEPEEETEGEVEEDEAGKPPTKARGPGRPPGKANGKGKAGGR